MTKLHIDYDAIVAEIRKKNISEIRKQLKNIDYDANMRKKVENYSIKYGIPKKYLLEKLMNDYDDQLLFGFETDPMRQNLAENIQQKFMKKLPIIINFAKLPGAGKDALVVSNGIITNHATAKGMKTIDFRWQYLFEGNVLTFYASCKYTKEIAGGAQTNQFKDIIKFHEEVSKVSDKNVFFFSITDGEHYHVPFTDDGITYNNKIEYLNNNFGTERNMASDTDLILWDIVQVIKKWIFNLENIDINKKIAEQDRLQNILDKYY